jgi:hypothetical protein
MIHAGPDLALRLEDLISAEFRRLAAIAPAVLPGVPAECMEVGGGVALWLGEGSPVNLGVGMGMIGLVGEAELESVEAFYHDRGAEAVISMCPLADRSLLEGLGRRGWHASDFEHVLALELGGCRRGRGDHRSDSLFRGGCGCAGLCHRRAEAMGTDRGARVRGRRAA